MQITEYLKNGLLYFDGATGTELQKLDIPSDIRPEEWNITNKNALINLHIKYLESGANIIKANTFGANRYHFENNTFSTKEIIEAAIKNAKDAIQLANCNREKSFIALDIGPTGKLLEPLGDLSFEEAVSVFAEMIKIGTSAGADLILIETMTDAYETKAAVIAAKENSNLPIFVSNTYDENAQLLTGATPETMVALLEGLGVDAIGVNCGYGPSETKEIVRRMYSVASTPIFANPNAGLPSIVNGKTQFNVNPEEFAIEMKEILTIGARALGGCCGTTPAHIEKVRDFTDNIQPLPLAINDDTVITSYTHNVRFKNETILIGERINPTGKPKLKEALRNNDLGYIIEEASTQASFGANVLDVNVGLPEIDEPNMMVQSIRSIQKVCNLPLQIDTSNAEALEKAMRIYNGKPLVNSVNGKESSMNTVFPLVAKYGGVVIALTLDENGIPNNAKERIAIAQKIIDKAKKYGISKKDIIVDPLAMAISVDENAAIVTLESIEGLSKLGIKTSLGVSNISFGLPNREDVNAAFFDVAIKYGLNAAIMNPYSSAMLAVAKDYTDDSKDVKYKYFTEIVRGQTPKITYTSAERESFTLKDCIIKGLKHNAAEKTAELLKSNAPLDIINSQIIPALNSVGNDFEKKLLFLPQLLASAETAQQSFEKIKEYYAKNGKSSISKGSIIMATVEGDIHDIGKNIVSTLLENYGFHVLDLGKDVPSKIILESAKNESIKFIGLSALMTTTVSSMKNTIEQLKTAIPDCFIVVGGAVLNQEYADQIGADRYAKDAIQTVNYAEEYFKKERTN